MLDKLQKRICLTVRPSFALSLSLSLSLESLAHRRNKASLKFSIGVTLVGVHLN